jgi:TusA-related sulfurtransferase
VEQVAQLALTLLFICRKQEVLGLRWKVDYILDVRKSITPLCLLKVTQLFRNMEPDQVLEILGYDPETREDFIKVLPASCFEMVIMEEDESPCRIQIKKRR